MATSKDLDAGLEQLRNDAKEQNKNNRDFAPHLYLNTLIYTLMSKFTKSYKEKTCLM